MSYVPNPKDWNSYSGIFIDVRDTYEVYIQDENLIIKDYINNKELIGHAITRNQ